MPTKRQILELFTRDELLFYLDHYELLVPDRRVKDAIVEALARAHRVHLADVLEAQKRARLKEMCRSLGIDDSGKEKLVIVDRLVGRHVRVEQIAQAELIVDAEPAPKAAPTVRPKATLPAKQEPTMSASAEAPPTLETVLDTLTQPRLLDLCRLFGSDIREPSTTKDRLVRRLAAQLRGGLPALLRELNDRPHNGDADVAV